MEKPKLPQIKGGFGKEKSFALRHVPLTSISQKKAHYHSALFTETNADEREGGRLFRGTRDKTKDLFWCSAEISLGFQRMYFLEGKSRPRANKKQVNKKPSGLGSRFVCVPGAGQMQGSLADWGDGVRLAVWVVLGWVMTMTYHPP